MNKYSIILPHHSASDWDFELPGWEISADTFVSPPTSLKFRNLTAVALGKNSFSTSIPKGQITAYFRGSTVVNFLGLMFRNQAAVGGSDWLNTYLVFRQLVPGIAYFQRREAGAAVWTANLTGLADLPIDTWHLFRLSWWESWGLFLMRLERYYAGTWYIEDEDKTDPVNKWSDSPINRVGLRGSAGGDPLYYDNFEACWP